MPAYLFVAEEMSIWGHGKSLKRGKLSPLFLAIKEGHTNVVEVLLQLNVELNHCKKSHYGSAFHYAVPLGRAEIVEVFPNLHHFFV